MLEEVSLEGQLRTTICHGDAAVTLDDGLPVKAPAQSGPVGAGSRESMVDGHQCQTFEFELPADAPVELLLTDLPAA